MSLLATLRQTMKKRFLRDVAFTYVSFVTNGASLFLVSIILGRSFSKEWFAAFSLSILVLSTVAEMSDLGLNGGLQRFAPFYIANKQFDKLKQLIRIIWRWRVNLTALITSVGVLGSYLLATYIFGQTELTGYLAVSFVGVGGVVFLGFINTFLQASQRFFYNAILQTLKGVVRLLLIASLVLFGVENMYAYLGVYIAVPWVLFLISFHVLPAGFQHVSLDAESRHAVHAQLARFSTWLTVWSLFSIVATRVDQVLVSRFLGLEQVAIYAVAYQLMQFYPLVAWSITAVLSPKISGFSTKRELIPFLKRAIKWTAVAMAACALVVYPSQYLITLFFGHEYDASLPVYRILALSLVANMICIPFNLVITAYNRTDLMAFSGVIQLIVNTVCAFILIPRFGIMGAGYTFMIGIGASILYNMTCSYYLLKKKEITVH
ncbi:MAG TPA: oligosaccharide flippase family protein [Candidatus Kapabacteria bacterium]|nr:oligosaccharide flippase family protein [Candidatus Kapabacteria bacterium]